MQITMPFGEDSSLHISPSLEKSPSHEPKVNCENLSEDEDDYDCLFCGGPRTSSRRCCSTECARHLDDYSNCAIPGVLMRTLLTLSIEDRITRINQLAASEDVSFESLIKHFIVQSKKMNIPQSDIFFTPKIAKFIKMTGNIPTFAILK